MMEKTVDMMLIAFCADYERREKALRNRTVSYRTEMEYRYYNFNIYEAAAEIVGDHLAEKYIADIGARRGYASTELADCYCEKTYKTRKSAIKESIARRLRLIES